MSGNATNFARFFPPFPFLWPFGLTPKTFKKQCTSTFFSKIWCDGVRYFQRPTIFFFQNGCRGRVARQSHARRFSLKDTAFRSSFLPWRRLLAQQRNQFLFFLRAILERQCDRAPKAGDGKHTQVSPMIFFEMLGTSMINAAASFFRMWPSIIPVTAFLLPELVIPPRLLV